MKFYTLFILFFICFVQLSYAQYHKETIFVGDTISISIENRKSLQIQWQSKSSISDFWQDIDGANSNNYSEVITAALNNKNLLLRAYITDSLENCPLYSETVQFKIVEAVEQMNYGEYCRGGYYFLNDEETLYLATSNRLSHNNAVGRWGCSGDTIRGANGITVGTGKQNTTDILQECNGPELAVVFCDTLTDNGYEDWFLPSIEELEILYENLVLQNEYRFRDGFGYWSSTEVNKDFAYKLSKSDPRFREAKNKGGIGGIAPIRTDSISNNIRIEKSLDIISIEEVNSIHITIIDSTDGTVKITFSGDTLKVDTFNWNFHGGIHQSGEGAGPYNIKYGRGGFLRVSLVKPFAGCSKDLSSKAILPLQNFKPIELGLPSIFDGYIKWFDFNNDDFKDLLITGSDTCFILKNIEGDTFHKANLEITGLNHTHCDVGDYNNDGYIDFVITGLDNDDSTPKTFLYENMEGDSFLLKSHTFPGVINGYLEWNDVNRDGFIDLFISGEIDSITNYAGLFLNDGLMLRQIDFPVPPLNYTTGAWGDYNLDGFDDFLYSGIHDSTLTTHLFKNNNGSFEEISHPFQDIYDGEMAWEDLDNDGLLDVIISGNKVIPWIYLDGPSRRVNTVDAIFSKTYKSHAFDSFSILMDFGNWTNQRCRSSLFSADYNLDGYADIFVTGSGPYSNVTASTGGASNYNMTYHYNIKSSRSSIFKNREGQSLQNMLSDIPIYISGIGSQGYGKEYKSAFIEGSDFNNDNKIDFIREGAGSDYTVQIYENLEKGTNQPPQIPENMLVRVDCDTAFFTWSHATDDHTTSTVLAYDVYIGSSPGQSDIVSKVNDYNLQDTFFILNRSLAAGTYYWSVRTKDNAKVFGNWAPEQSFTIHLPETPEIRAEGDTLYSNIDSGNQWYDETGAIPRATDPTYVILQSGTYYNIVTQNGCTSDTSNILEVFLSTDRTPVWADQISIYPNPFRETIRITSEGLSGVLKYEMHNSLGQLVQSGAFRKEVMINTNRWVEGAYSLKVKYEGETINEKILKQ